MVLRWAHFDKLHEINVASSLGEVKVSFWKKLPYYYSPLIKTSIIDWNCFGKLWNINHVCLFLVVPHIAIFVHIYLSKRLKKSKILYKYYTLKYYNWVHIQYTTTFFLDYQKQNCY